jgi:hypothetical protein
MSSPPEGAERAPAVVHEVVGSPGESLDPATRESMEASLGADFGSVRIHRDDRAARSADAVGAAAYTVGDHVAFNRDLYRPETADGRKLLEHELAHVAEEGGAAVPSALRVGRASDTAERVADARAAARPGGAPARAPGRPGRGRTAVLRRTVLGTILGGALGALGGALIGGLLGGPIGAIVGGAVGLLGGALAGGILTARSRPLSQPEIDYAKEIYVDSVDYSKITITRGSPLALGAARTIGNTINLQADHFVGDTLELSEFGKLVLIHEMGHVWQYQNGGLAYIPDSLLAQFQAVTSGGDRNAAYDWRQAHRERRPWEHWNPEQQAGAIEDYNRLLRKQQAGLATPDDLHELSILLPYIEKVRRGEGAPMFGSRSGSPARQPAPSGSSGAPGGSP